MANFSKGKIAIPNVTGNVVINIEAVESAPTYINLIPLSVTEIGGSTIYGDGLGYKDGYRYNSSYTETANNGTFTTGYIPVSAGDTLYFSGTIYSGHSATFNSAFYNASGTVKKAINPSHFSGGTVTDVQPYGYDSVNQILHYLTVPASVGEGGWVKFTFIGGGENAVVTKNQPIEQ